MKRSKIESGLEREFLQAMITSQPFLASVHAKTDVALFEQAHARHVAGWCLAHYQKFKEAPGKKVVRSIMKSWLSQDKLREDDADAVADLVEGLPAEAEPVNVPYLVDALAEYLTSQNLWKLYDNLGAMRSQGRTEEAVQLISDFRGVRLGDASGFDALNDPACFDRAFADPSETVIRFPGAAGELFNSTLVRDSLVGVQGPEKRGKTFWCLEFAMRALRTRSRVAFFEVGDLSESQIVRRMGVRYAQTPMRIPKKPIMMPTSIGWEDVAGERKVVAQYKKMPFDYALDSGMAKRAQRNFNRLYHLPDKPHFMVSVHPISSINVKGIDGVLQQWRHELQFVPDVIIVDYADILAPENPREEHRHQVNSTWKALKRLSQDWHACVIAPTQANAQAYKQKTQTMSNFSEDKRKLSHVTGMLTLNQTEQEKQDQIMRINWALLREDEYVSSRSVHVAQCIPLGMAFVKGTW